MEALIIAGFTVVGLLLALAPLFPEVTTKILDSGFIPKLLPLVWFIISIAFFYFSKDLPLFLVCLTFQALITLFSVILLMPDKNTRSKKTQGQWKN